MGEFDGNMGAGTPTPTGGDTGSTGSESTAQTSSYSGGESFQQPMGTQGVAEPPTPELKDWQRKLQQEQDAFSRERKAFQAEQQQNRALQELARHPEIQRAMKSHADGVADHLIRAGVWPAAAKGALVNELKNLPVEAQNAMAAGAIQNQQQIMPQAQQPLVMPPMPPTAGMTPQQIDQMVNQRLEHALRARDEQAQLQQARSRNEQEIAEIKRTNPGVSDDQIFNLINYCHANKIPSPGLGWKLMNYEKAMSEAEARGRRLMATELNRGFEETAFGGVPAAGDDPEIAAFKKKIREA